MNVSIRGGERVRGDHADLRIITASVTENGKTFKARVETVWPEGEGVFQEGTEVEFFHADNPPFMWLPEDLKLMGFEVHGSQEHGFRLFYKV